EMTLSSADAASPSEISLRQRSSCMTEVDSDHIRGGAASCSPSANSKPLSDRHAVTTRAASTTSKLAAGAGRFQRRQDVGHRRAVCCSAQLLRQRQRGEVGQIGKVLLLYYMLSSNLACA